MHRRAFLADLGRGAFAIALVSVAGCSPNALASFSSTPTPGVTTEPDPASPGDSGGTAPTDGAGPPSPGGPVGSAPTGGVAWERVNLGFVSAYLLVRGGEAALVDTGVAESTDSIEAVLGEIGLAWSAVGHVILTHHHSDHAGSIAGVMERAPGAAAYAGAEDIPSISAPSRPVNPVADGDRVFDLDIVTTPGHTAGSICVLDPIAGVLVAGDALRTESGLPTLPGGQFTVDMDQARLSVAKLGALKFETLLVGHGEPIEGGASDLVVELARTS